MNTFTLGLRNAFRNAVRSISIMFILGLSIGLCLVMLIADQAVKQKINDVKSAVGTTITIAPAGFNSFSDANNALTTSSVDKVKSLAHITNLAEVLADRLTTIGAAQPSFSRFGGDANTNAQTSLTSPVTLNTNGDNNGGIGSRIFVNGGGSLPANFSLPVPIVGTTDPTKLNSNDAILKSGAMLDGAKDSNDAMISTAMASKNNLGVGSTFTAYGQTLQVVGLFDTGNQGANSTVVVSLATLQRLTGQTGDITSAVATVDTLDNLSAATTAVKNMLGSSADVQSAQEEANNAVQPLENVASISLISLMGAVIAGGVIILLTMVMIVRERRREIGILKAIGASNSRVVLQFMSEALTLTVAGALIGVVIGVAGGNPVTNMLVSSSTTASLSSTAQTSSGGARFAGGGRFFGTRSVTGNFLQRSGNGLLNSASNVTTNIGWSILAYGLAASLLIAAIGSSFAGWMIARVKPYEVMRAE